MQCFIKAVLADAEAISKLVNSAYRGESSRLGWTTEADLLDGLRTDSEEVEQLINSDQAMILLCLKEFDLVGAVCLENEQGIVHVGMFVVNPVLQGRGIGKQLLAAAEELAKKTWPVQKFQMQVITFRNDLIRFYERRGYARTGILSPFQVNPGLWQPKINGLELEVLEKSVA